MRVLTLVLLLGALPALAQSEPPSRYWIFVGATQPASAPAPEAQARRALRGSGTPTDRTLTADARDALRALGIEVQVESQWLGAVSASLDARQRESVAALPFVREVRAVGRIVTAEGPDAAVEALPLVLLPDYGASAGQLQIVGADDVIEAGYTGAGVRIGFLDTLFDFDHPALVALKNDGRLVAMRDFTGQGQSNYHGLSTTSVTLGFADGALVGPAYSAEVLAATTEYAPTETRAEEDYFIAGLEWLEANGVDVVSISLGYSVFDEGEGDYTYDDLDGDTAVITRAVDQAAARGVVVVVSAGNEGSGPWRYIGAPADADSVITVGGVTSSGVHASFSSYGPTADGRIKPDVAAQAVGVYVATRGGGYARLDGTSFAAPMVAGIAAQLLQANPTLTPIQIRAALRQTASQSAAPDTVLGWGIVNAGAALEYVTPVAVDGRPAAPTWHLAPSVARTGDVLTVETPEPAPLAIYDLMGRRVARIAGSVGRRTVPVPDLPVGLYLVRPEGERPLLPRRLVIVR